MEDQPRRKRLMTATPVREEESKSSSGDDNEEFDDTPLTKADIPKIVEAVLNNIPNGSEETQEKQDNPHLDCLLEPIHQRDTQLLPYHQWLQQWQNHLTPVPLFNHVPVKGSSIHTPLISAAWRQYLKEHPHQNLVQYFLQSTSLGFRVGFDGSGTQSAQKNLQSAVDHPTVVDNYLQNELSLGRMSGPYPPSSCPGVHLNRFGGYP